MTKTSQKQTSIQRLCEWISGPPGQTSLFHQGEAEPRRSVLPDLWELLRHPVRSFREERQAPRTRASLFRYIETPEEAAPLDWKGLLKDLVTGYRFALFIPSLWADQAELVEGRAELRLRRIEAGAASLVVHVMIVALGIFFALHKSPEGLTQPKDTVVFVSNPMPMPFIADDREGGGGGGGGKHEKLPASGGRLPDAVRVQFVPPDPGMPKPLLPSDNSLDMKPGIQAPIDLPSDSSLPIGDPSAPPSDLPSSGPGSGGGIGNGSGTGVGSGRGSGAGSGEGSGYGNGRGDGIGDGVGLGMGGKDLILPEAILKPTPYYTEEARKARTEGMVVLQVMIRKNGTIDNIKVVRGLGNGLDEAAISTVASKWRFRPARYRGSSIDFPALIEVLFRLY